MAISIPEVATDETLHRRVAALAAEAGAIFQTHVNEHLVAVERSLVERKLRPLEHLAAAKALGPQTLIAHSTLVTPPELMLLARTDTAVAYNPVASTWKGNAVAPAEMMAELGIRFGIGTDGTRSDAFRMIEAAETLQRIAFGIGVGDFSCGGGWTWLDRATHGAADAVGLKCVTGEIAIGKAADLLIVDTDIPEFSPSWDLDWELVRYGNRDQIVAVIVAGKLRSGAAGRSTGDARALLAEVKAMAGGAVARAPDPAHPSDIARPSRAAQLARANDRSHRDHHCGGDRRALIQGAIGVGFALVVAPLAAVLRPDLLPGSILLLMLPLNAYVAWRERTSFDLSGASWITAGRFFAPSSPMHSFDHRDADRCSISSSASRRYLPPLRPSLRRSSRRARPPSSGPA